MKPPRPCFCGKPRPRFLIVCPDCWKSIPRDLRTRIALLPIKEQLPATREALADMHGAASKVNASLI